MIDIQHSIKDTKGYFTAYVNGKTAGMLSYTSAGETGIILDHTEVNKNYKGQSIGKQLVMNSVEYARTNHLKIMPLCPFAKAIFDKTESIRDVLY